MNEYFWQCSVHDNFSPLSMSTQDMSQSATSDIQNKLHVPPVKPALF